MDFTISKKQPPTSEVKDEHQAEGDVVISSQLRVISSSDKPLDKDVVLRRIRHHKNLNKFNRAFKALLMNGSAATAASIPDPEWLDLEDAFSTP
ncbi:hypothetical protein Nepgr_008279 [Nepenthes gracilis]|uniref:Uncharacterized protein n=1 Tax=Nepenthes gracilis TaxID=150966 RepID=A0AAD3S8K3_NEPGR|nr:hypothetical protein Nepgr_008279 [Nepenthes gracilis]